MLSTLEYNKDVAHVRLRCRITRVDSQQEFAYEVLDLDSEFDAVWAEQVEYLFPDRSTTWCGSEEEARKELIRMVTEAYDMFNSWPQYKGHAYLPNAVYHGEEQAYPPGVDIHKL